jgi:hypothetical protein
MPLDPLTSLCIGVAWVLVCVGIGAAPELAVIVRALRARYFRK